MAIEGCMHVVVCSVFLAPVFALANGFRFTAIPFIFNCMSSNICSCALVPLSNRYLLPCVA